MHGGMPCRFVVWIKTFATESFANQYFLLSTASVVKLGMHNTWQHGHCALIHSAPLRDYTLRIRHGARPATHVLEGSQQSVTKCLIVEAAAAADGVPLFQKVQDNVSATVFRIFPIYSMPRYYVLQLFYLLLPCSM